MPFASAKYLQWKNIRKMTPIWVIWDLGTLGLLTHLTYKVLVVVVFDSAIDPQKVMIWPSISVSPSNSWNTLYIVQYWERAMGRWGFPLGYSWSCSHWACSAQTRRTGWKSGSPGLLWWSMCSLLARRTLSHTLCALLIHSRFLRDNHVNTRHAKGGPT